MAITAVDTELLALCVMPLFNFDSQCCLLHEESVKFHLKISDVIGTRETGLLISILLEDV